MAEDVKIINLSVAELTELCRNALAAYQVDAEHAEIVAEALVWCDLHGISSHGLNMLPTYLERLKKGGINPNRKPAIINNNQRGAVCLIDGNGGFGQVMARFAADLASDLARKHGVGVVSIKNGNHAGALGFYTERIVTAGNIGFMVHNSNPTTAPFGGNTAALGTNPISFAFPGKEFPVIVDMATSATAKGKIYAMSRKGDEIPAGLAVDKDGIPTTSATAAIKGVLLPMAGPKGYSLSVAVELLTSILSGGLYNMEIGSLHRDADKPQGVSMLIAAISLDVLMPISVYKERVEHFTEHIRRTRKAQGIDRIYLPGEIEALRAKQRLISGIPIQLSLYNEVKDLIDKEKENRRIGK